MGSSDSRDDRHHKIGPTGGKRGLTSSYHNDVPGVMWPTDGFEANQYSPAGEVAAFGRFFQALQRRWRRRGR